MNESVRQVAKRLVEADDTGRHVAQASERAWLELEDVADELETLGEKADNILSGLTDEKMRGLRGQYGELRWGRGVLKFAAGWRDAVTTLLNAADDVRAAKPRRGP